MNIVSIFFSAYAILCVIFVAYCMYLQKIDK